MKQSLLYQRILFFTVWFRCTFPFINEEILDIPKLAQIPMLLTDGVFVILGLLTLRNRRDRWVVMTFLFVSYICTMVLNHTSIIFYINALREFITFLFLIPIFRYFSENQEREHIFKNSLDRQLFIFLWVQVFCVTWQFFKYGAGDHGGGSLGNYNSGIITTLIYMFSFYLMHKRIDPNHVLESIKRNALLIFLLFPTMLNETKIGFIYIVLYFLLLMPIDMKLFKRIFIIVPTIIVMLNVILSVYVSTADNSIYSEDNWLMEYLTVEDVENTLGAAEWSESENLSYDMPRFAKLGMIPLMFSEHPMYWITGAGIGQFKGGTTLAKTDFSEQWYWAMDGTIPYLYFMVIQLGYIGVALFVIYWILYLIRPIKPGYKRDPNIQLWLLALIIITLFYHDAFRNSVFGFFFMMMTYYSWHPSEPKENNTPTATPVAE